MYSVRVRDRVMVAHSFKGAIFGPAQRLHGATFIVDVTFKRRELSADNIVVDIARAHEVLRGVLHEIAFRNLDELPQFEGQNTTTEFLARWVFDCMAGALRKGALGAGSEGIAALAVEIAESDVAWAGFEGTLD